MAIYHLHCDIIGRSKGQSAVAAAAYRSTSKLIEEETGEVKDYTKKEKALLTDIYCDTSKGIPEWLTSREALWNAVQQKENRKNSQFCRSFDIALMSELSLSQNTEILQKWLFENYVKRGLVADVAIHAPHKNKDGTTNKNVHAHILIPTRFISKDGWGEKDREANSKEFILEVRKSWANIVNAKFRELGMSERIDERTLEAQGIDREPQQHQGVAATAIERKGGTARLKKYKSQEINESPKTEISVTDEEAKNALFAESETFQNLVSTKNNCVIFDKKEAVVDDDFRLISFKESEAEKAERAFGKYTNLVLNPPTPTSDNPRKRTNRFIEGTQRQELFYYVKNNYSAEVDFWNSRKSKDVHDVGFNKLIESHKATAKAIFEAGDWNRQIYPKVDDYYKVISGEQHNPQMKTHWDKVKSWIATTDLVPVKICRIVIDKLRQWRDERFPQKTISRKPGPSMSD